MTGRSICTGIFIALAAAGAFSEVFVADFNGDGKPDVLISSPASADGFIVLINQGEIDGKLSFRKAVPDIKASGAYAASTAATPAATVYQQAAEPQNAWGAASSTPAWSPAPAAPKDPVTVVAPPAAIKPSIQPPPAPTISTGAPKLKPVGGAGQAEMERRPQPEPARVERAPEARPPAPAPVPAATRRDDAPMAMPAGPRRTALFNFKDKTSGSQFAWLERGIANILKFDVMEVKNIQLIDREKTDRTFDPASYKAEGPLSDIIITGEFAEAGERLVVTTWFLSPNMASLREFRVEGDRGDIFSLIEKVGAKIKQELSSL